MQAADEKKVSYCTTCHGRLWQIALTLHGNLDRLCEDEELVLLDYGSPDGLARFVESSPRCRAAIDSGQLIYARTEAPRYHCPKAKNLAHRLARGRLLVNLDADNSNRGIRRAIDRCFVDPDEDIILQMDEGSHDDPLRGTFGRICIPRYWFYRLGGYDESFQPIGHQDGDLLWRAKALGLRRVASRSGSPPPIRNTMVEKASHTGEQSWHAMWRANEQTSRRNLKEGRLVANLQGWGAADVQINFNEGRSLAPVTAQLVSLVILARRDAAAIESLLDQYDANPLVGEILLVNRNPDISIERIENGRAQVTIINTRGESRPFAGLAAASLASFPTVALTTDDAWLPPETLSALHKAWFANPSILHGLTRASGEVISSANDAATSAVIEASRPTDLALNRCLLTGVQNCVAALTYASRLLSEVPEIGDGPTQETLLFFVSTRGSGKPNRAYHLPVLELDPVDGAPAAPSRKSRQVVSAIASWCRRNVSDAASAGFAITVGPSAPDPVGFEPPPEQSDRDAVLFAGPWVGEFGWELCWWNPLLRALSEEFEHVIVAAPESSRYLYEFAAEFIPLRTEGHCFAEGRLLSKVPPVCNGTRLATPSDLWTQFGLQECHALKSGEPSVTPKKWRPLGPTVPGAFVADVLCAFRPEKRIEGRRIEGKEYPLHRCAELVELLLDSGLTVACYGGRDNYSFTGTLDLRGALLEVQCAALSAAKCAVGPSSGPLHLASLCSCPVVSWSRISPNMAIRYENHWNPFDAPVRFLTPRAPSPDEVAIATLNLIDALGGERLAS